MATEATGIDPAQGRVLFDVPVADAPDPATGNGAARGLEAPACTAPVLARAPTEATARDGP